MKFEKLIPWITIALLSILTATLLASCASSKVFMRECEKIENGWICND